MNGYKRARYLIAGDRGISVEFGNVLEEEVNRRVQKMMYALEKARLPGVIECNPTIRSLFVYYDPLAVGVKRLIQELRKIEGRMADITLPKSRLFEIPIVYGGKYGPDLDLVAKLLNLTPEAIVDLHSGKEYFIYDTGFSADRPLQASPAPGFIAEKKNSQSGGAHRFSLDGRRIGERLQAFSGADGVVLDRHVALEAVVPRKRPPPSNPPRGQSYLPAYQCGGV